MQSFLQKYGPWAVVTGASSGIGEEFARQLAALKFNLVLVARRADRLERLEGELRQKHEVEVKVVAADLASLDCLVQLDAATRGLDVGLLVNSAGFALTGDFLDHALEHELSMLHVNCRAPMMFAHHFGQTMVRRGRGGIINVASASAFMPLPYWAQYSASKVYLLHFSEALWFELKQYGVDVLALCPGSTRTEFSQVAGTNMQGMEVTPVVKQALRSLGKRISVVPGFGNRLATLIGRFLTRRRAIIIGAMVIGKAASVAAK